MDGGFRAFFGPMSSIVTMRKIYHLSTCSTCQRILKTMPKLKSFELQDIKTEPITPAQLDEMKKLAGSYEALFSKIARKYRSEGLNEQALTEKDYRKLILGEYTFLKRPVMVIGSEIFIGNAPKVTAAMVEAAKG
jgi:arsenate reductase